MNSQEFVALLVSLMLAGIVSRLILKLFGVKLVAGTPFLVDVTYHVLTVALVIVFMFIYTKVQ